MQVRSGRDVLRLAEQEASDAVLHARGGDSLVFHPDSPLPLPPLPPASGDRGFNQRRS
jgi:hypothetical protein